MKSLKFIYLLGWRSIKIRSREDLWRLHENYPIASTTIGPVLGPLRYNRIKIIENAAFPGAVVLDAGCNIGEIGAYLISQGCIVYGVDVNPEFIKICKSRGIFASVCPVEKLTFADNFFDLCIAGELLEHLYKPEEGIAQLHRVLKPGGTLVATCPGVLNKFAEHSKYQYIWHQHDFTIKGLREMLGKYFKPKNILIRKYTKEKDEWRLHFKAVKDASI